VLPAGEGGGGFDQGIGVEQQQIIFREANLLARVGGGIENAQGHVGFVAGLRRLGNELPGLGGGTIPERRGMARVGEVKIAGWSPEGDDDGGGETHEAVAGLLLDGELAIHLLHDAGLIDVVDVLAQDAAKFEGKAGNLLPVTGDIRDEHASDAPGSTTRQVMDIAARRITRVRFAEDVSIEAGHGDSAEDVLVAAPHLRTCERMRFHLILPNDSQPRAVAKSANMQSTPQQPKHLGDSALTGVYTFVA
jgi:hypothetical protein